MVHTLLATEDLKRLPGGLSLLDDVECFLDRLIRFGSAGLRSIPKASAPGTVESLAEAQEAVSLSPHDMKSALP
jgi:hypothetical protein